MNLRTQIQSLGLAQPVAIIGAGVTGLSCVRLLACADIDYTVFDERNSLSDESRAATRSIRYGLEFTSELFADYGTILLSPGVDTRRACFAAHEAKLLTDIELFARLVDKPLIGVTGSNGKSTVVTLLHDVMTASGNEYHLCGNIGLPVLDALLAATDTTEGYIVELSSYHLERSPSLHLAIGVWLNVSPDHLDRYNSYDEYVATKAKIFAQSDVVVANADDERVYAYAQRYPHVLYFSRRSHRHVDWMTCDGEIYSYHHRGGQVTETREGTSRPVFALKDFSQIGMHHADNLMAVFAAASRLGVDYSVIADACRSFKPLACRSVVVGKKDGVTFINDSKGTNIGATVAAINGISQPLILIAGGQGKGQDFSELAAATHGRVKTCIVIGESAVTIQRALSSSCECIVANDLCDAVTKALMVAVSGDVVMLSPACASFDMFESYLQRGEIFENIVQEWINA